MALNRICRISGHRIFRDFSWPNELEDFKRYNLIYGWNGSDKSTLANLFRCIETRRPVVEGTITFRIDGRDVHGASLATVVQQIRVFNKEFVSDNVFTAAHRLQPIYVIGKESIEKQERLNAVRELLAHLQSEIQTRLDAVQDARKAKDDLCIANARVIKEALGAHGNQYSNYNKRDFRQKLDSILSTGSAQSFILDEESKQRLQTQTRMSPKPRISQEVYEPPDFEGICAQTSELLSRRVESTVIDSLKTDATACFASWTTGPVPSLLQYSSNTGTRETAHRFFILG